VQSVNNAIYTCILHEEKNSELDGWRCGFMGSRIAGAACPPEATPKFCPAAYRFGTESQVKREEEG
jgi:hypothetical protein